MRSRRLRLIPAKGGLLLPLLAACAAALWLFVGGCGQQPSGLGREAMLSTDSLISSGIRLLRSNVTDSAVI